MEQNSAKPPPSEQPPREQDYSLSSPSPSRSSQRDRKQDDDDSLLSEVEVGDGDDRKIVRYKYCCKICKHPDKTKKACVCVVPKSQRRAELGSGCRNCGCTGCSKEDYISKGEDPEYRPGTQKLGSGRKYTGQPAKREEARPEQRPRERSRERKSRNSPPRKRRSTSRSPSPQPVDPYTMKFYNFDHSLIGSMISMECQVNPTLLGFAIPQRTYSYIFGRPR